MKLAGRLAQQLASSRLGKAVLGGEGKDILIQNIPGAVTGGLFTLAGTGSIPAALATAGLDMGLSYGGARLAGKLGAPGVKQTILREEVKDGVKSIQMIPEYRQSMAQNLASGACTVASVMIAPTFLPATQLAAEDPLTGLNNRRSFVDLVTAQKNAGRPLTLVFIDLDRFKPLNDQYGHAVGDQVLREIGRRLIEQTYVIGAARLGGD